MVEFYIFIFVNLLIIIATIVYGKRKINRIKKELKKTTLFDDLINSGFILSNSTDKDKETRKWFSKKNENDEFEYHCSFNVDRNKINFEALLEIKRRVKNNNSGFIHDIKLSRRHKEKGFHLAGNMVTKFYKTKKVSDLPKVNEIKDDFKEMIKVLRKENIKTLTKFDK